MSPRGFTNEAEIKRLTMTTAFIDGTLAPVNTGMQVDSQTVLKQAGYIWKDYKMEFEGKGNPVELKVNYLQASNAEVAVALSIAEALPSMKLSRDCTITFSPEGQPSQLTEWVNQAQTRGKSHPLYEDEIDWDYLVIQIRDFIKSLR